jgi:hypothetical protein
MDISKTLMFMAHIPVADMSNVVTTMLEYQSVGNYIVSAETKPYHHLHFLVEMTEQDYKRFSKRVFVDTYKLRGLAGRKGTKDAGKPKQYGKMKNIRDIVSACEYTIKDGNYLSNLPETLLLEFLKNSFQKPEIDVVDEAVKSLNPEIICTQYEFNNTTDPYVTYSPAPDEYYKNDKNHELPSGYTLGQVGDFRRNLRLYAAKIYETIGPVKNFRQRLIHACYKYKYISTEELMMIVYRF